MSGRGRILPSRRDLAARNRELEDYLRTAIDFMDGDAPRFPPSHVIEAWKEAVDWTRGPRP